MHTFVESGDQNTIARGSALIKQGKVGCILLAGGSGTRLGWKGPKGTFPVARGKTLFDIFLERTEKGLPLAVMTSSRNHDETAVYFGDRAECFQQSMAPLLDEEGNELSTLFPMGNGVVLKCFVESGIFAKWEALGVSYVQIVLVDNPLAAPFDPNQVGVQDQTEADVTLKVVKKAEVKGDVGLVGWKEGKLCVVEYSENPPKEWNLANTSLFSFEMKWIKKIAMKSLPEHRVKKKFEGEAVYVREQLIFDLLRFADKAEAILYPKHQIFAPIKSLSDVEEVKVSLESSNLL